MNTQYQKTIKPFIEKPFIPTEVDKLQEQQKKTYSDISMTNAILVGPKEIGKGQEVFLNSFIHRIIFKILSFIFKKFKKPTMYSTVITKHPTVIRHQIPQPVNIGVHEDTTRAMAVDPSETLDDDKRKMANGAYSIPIKISNGAIKDPTLSGYETPNFISKGEKKLQESSGEQLENVDPAIFLKKNMEKDIGQFLAQFDNSKDKTERIQACILN